MPNGQVEISSFQEYSMVNWIYFYLEIFNGQVKISLFFGNFQWSSKDILIWGYPMVKWIRNDYLLLWYRKTGLSK